MARGQSASTLCEILAYEKHLTIGEFPYPFRETNFIRRATNTYRPLRKTFFASSPFFTMGL
jgi:hypothetical protein